MGKIAKLTVLGLSLVSLMACGDENQETTSGGGNDETLLVMLSEEPAEGDALINSLNTWADESGNEVETLVVPYDDQLSSFRSMIQNNDAPDLVGTTRLTRLYPEQFLDLSEVVDRSMFDQTALEIIAQDDELDSRLLVVPNQYTFTLWFYNADAFEEVGIEPPTNETNWTIDELYEYGQELQNSGAVNYGVAVDFSRHRYDNLMYSDGGSITVREEDEILINAAANENVEALEKFVEQNENGVMPSVIWAGGSSDNPVDYFQNGDVGIFLSGTWNYDLFSNNISDFEFGVMPSPEGVVQRSVLSGGAGLAIPESAENSELAQEFIQWLYEEENYENYIIDDRGIPFVEGIEIEYEDEKTANDFDIIQNEMNYVTDEFLLDHSSNWTNYLDNEYRDYLRRAVAGELTPQEALDQFSQDLHEQSGWEINE